MGEGTPEYAASTIQASLLPWGEGQGEGRNAMTMAQPSATSFLPTALQPETPEAKAAVRQALAADSRPRRAAHARPHAGCALRHLLDGEIWRHVLQELMYDYENTQGAGRTGRARIRAGHRVGRDGRRRDLRPVAGADGLQAAAMAGPRRRRVPALSVSRPRIHAEGRVRGNPQRSDGFLLPQISAARRGSLRGALPTCPICRAGIISAWWLGLRAFNKPSVRQAFENLFKVAAEVDAWRGTTSPLASALPS